MKILKTLMLAIACGGLYPAGAMAQTYQKVTEAGQLESGKRYLIVAEGKNKAWNGLNTSESKGDVTDVDISDNVSANPVLLVKKSDGYWNIVDILTRQYVGTTASPAGGLVGASTASTNRYVWTISFDDGTIKVMNNSLYLKYYENSGSPFFRVAGVNEQTDIALYKETGASLYLPNSVDNTATIAAANGNKYNVTLVGRTLWKDGNWNTLCLPFNLTLAGSPLAGADARTLSSASLSDGTLNLTFTDAVTELMAGTPYIIKWAKDDEHPTISDPTFTGVTVSNAGHDFQSTDEKVKFLGTYAYRTFAAENKSILFVGGENTLYYPETGARIGTQRAYFQITDASSVKAFVLNFEDGDATRIGSLLPATSTSSALGWSDLSGRKLQSKPTAKGLYINNGRIYMVK